MEKNEYGPWVLRLDVLAALRAHTAQPAGGVPEMTLLTEYGSGVEAAYLEGFEDGWDQKQNDVWPFDKAQAMSWEDSQMHAALAAAPRAHGAVQSVPEGWRLTQALTDVEAERRRQPTTRRRDLVKAGALILAEIERLDRAAAPQPEEPK